MRRYVINLKAEVKKGGARGKKRLDGEQAYHSLRSRRYSRAQGGKLEIPPAQKLSILSSVHRAHGSAHTNDSAFGIHAMLFVMVILP